MLRKPPVDAFYPLFQFGLKTTTKNQEKDLNSECSFLTSSCLAKNVTAG